MPSPNCSSPMVGEAAASCSIYGEADGDTGECLAKINADGGPDRRQFGLFVRSWPAAAGTSRNLPVVQWIGFGPGFVVLPPR